MKNSTLFFLFILLLPAGSIFGQVAGSTVKGWTTKDRSEFMVECVKAAKDGLSEDSAKYYCYCMQSKIETKYPDVDEAAKITAQDLESPEWKKMVQSCLGGYWTSQQRTTFMADCIGSAKESIGTEKAKSYCECMMFKVQMKYPDFNDTNQLTAEKLQSPEWKKLIKNCLDF